MKKYILTLITILSICAPTSYSAETYSEILYQQISYPLSEQEIIYDDFDTHIVSDYTKKSRLDNLLNNQEQILSSIDEAAEKLNFPLLKHYGFTYLNTVKRQFFDWKEDEMLDLAFKHQSREDAAYIQNIFKREIQKSIEESERPLACDAASISQPVNNRTIYGDRFNILPDQKLNVSHGGNFFYILGFLLGMEKGYPLESKNELGIQVTPFINDSYLKYKPYNYAIEHRSLLDYSAVLFAEIQAQNLKEAPNGCEAGLRTENRNKLSNIRIEIIKAHTSPHNIEFHTFRLNDQDETFIQSKAQEAIHYLESLGTATTYRQNVINALQNIQFLDFTKN